MKLTDEIARRRTFAIISHPDAGKTTLTEKLLLYGGAVQLAGSVTARDNRKATASDWMELEKKRGISISSAALQFEYNGHCVNLLDTPGHKDFSEDTYRVLTAVDAVVMVIDAAKGIENQTRKLFEICRLRGIPIFTFMNKLDRPTREPLALLDELESVLGISAVAVNWPLGNGEEFRGVFDRIKNQVHSFERTPGGAYRAPVSIAQLSDPAVRENLSPAAYKNLVEEIDILSSAGSRFSPEEVLNGTLTPVLFGSASNNFGVKYLLDFFLQYSAAPSAHKTSSGEHIEPADNRFSGFVFKIQANMDPRHRDRIAFLRICSGTFEREMSVFHRQTGKKIRLSSAHRLFGQERETVDVAYPGDVIGLVGTSDLAIGDTLTDDLNIEYDEIPRFAPECFAFLNNSNTANFKRYRQGLDQLLHEGVAQKFQLHPATRGEAVLGAVGPLQFEVLQYRLESEYRAQSRLETAPWTTVRWLCPSYASEDLHKLSLPSGSRLAIDPSGRYVILFSAEWALNFFTSKNPTLRLYEAPQESAKAASSANY